MTTLDDLQRLHEAARQGHATVVHLDGYHESRVIVANRVAMRCDTLDEPACANESELHAAMRNALPALLRIAKAAQQLRAAMTTAPNGHDDGGHAGYWWTVATEKAAEEVAEAVQAMDAGGYAPKP